MLKAAIITIGDELLIGDTINTNSAWLGKRLTDLGITVNFSCVIPDNEVEIIKYLNQLSVENDIIITTGGLGPTNDDITKRAIANYFKVRLIENNDTKLRLIGYFKDRGRKITEENFEQALLPSCSDAMVNKVGTAPGILTFDKNKVYFNLPGVPNEMKSIFNDNMIKILSEFKAKYFQEYFIYRTFFTTGIYESEIANRILEIELSHKNIKFAYLPSYSGVRLRLGILNTDYESNINLYENIFQLIEKKLETYIITENKPILNAIFEILIGNNLTISVAESCTGGGLGSLLSEIPGSSKILLGGFIVYSNKAKKTLLNVNENTLKKFGAVSEQTAIELAINCREIMNSDLAISITGVAGPTGGTKDKPVGTVWIGISDSKKVTATKFSFLKDRKANRELSIYSALSLLYRKLKYNID